MKILSLYTSLIVDDGANYVYNAQSNFLCQISDDVLSILRKGSFEELPKDIISIFEKNKVIVDSADKYDYYYQELVRFNTHNYDPTVLSLVICPTTSCNFDCPYCFEPKLNPKTMTQKVIDGIKEFVKKNESAKRLEITWYGGEPLLAFEQIKSIIQTLETIDGCKIGNQSIITNGYLFDEEKIDFFKTQNISSIQITFDGLPERHNNSRKLKVSGKPTFDVIVANIKKLAQELSQTQISVRINIDKSMVDEYVELVNILRSKLGDLKNVSFYPGILRKETADGKAMVPICYTTSQMLDLHRLLREKGQDVRLFPQRTGRGCMINAKYAYIIGPEGEIYKCWNDVSDHDKIIGSIFEEHLSNPGLMLKYMVAASPFNDECRECKVFPICQAGCGLHRFRNKFENAKFDVCCPMIDDNNLKISVLSLISIKQNPINPKK